jgi:predicted transcriptional regulator
MEQELQIVMQQVSPHDTSRTGIVKMWQKLKEYHVTVEGWSGWQGALFLVNDYHFNNRRFMSLVYAVFTWRAIAAGDLQELCRTCWRDH